MVFASTTAIAWHDVIQPFHKLHEHMGVYSIAVVRHFPSVCLQARERSAWHIPVACHCSSDHGASPLEGTSGSRMTTQKCINHRSTTPHGGLLPLHKQHSARALQACKLLQCHCSAKQALPRGHDTKATAAPSTHMCTDSTTQPAVLIKIQAQSLRPDAQPSHLDYNPLSVHLWGCCSKALPNKICSQKTKLQSRKVNLSPHHWSLNAWHPNRYKL